MSWTERYGHTCICRTQIKPNWARKTRTTIQKFIQWLRKGQKTGLVKLAYFQSSRGRFWVACHASAWKEVYLTFWIVVYTLISQLKPKGLFIWSRVAETTLPPSYPGRDIFPLICLKKLYQPFTWGGWDNSGWRDNSPGQVGQVG